jgi:hypothetical protein
MQNVVILRCFAVTLAVAVVGCSVDGREGGSSTAELPQPVNTPPPYPAGPYGTTKGSIVAQYQFVGYQNAQTEHSATQPIQLADFYNPHADDTGYAPASSSEDDRLFPVGSTYGSGALKPKALSISVSSLWCGACKNEAKTVLPAKHLKYKPLGGEFLVQINDGTTPGHSADQQDLLTWTSYFHVDFPATIDPGRQLDALFVAQAYPTNIILDTRSMTIVEVIAGVPSDAYWTKFEDTLAAP